MSSLINLCKWTNCGSQLTEDDETFCSVHFELLEGVLQKSYGLAMRKEGPWIPGPDDVKKMRDG